MIKGKSVFILASVFFMFSDRGSAELDPNNGPIYSYCENKCFEEENKYGGSVIYARIQSCIRQCEKEQHNQNEKEHNQNHPE